VPFGEGVAELLGPTELVVADDPGVRDRGAVFLDEIVGEFPALLEGNVLGDVRLGATLRIIDPTLSTDFRGRDLL